MKEKNKSDISLDDRLQNEKETYAKGLDRKGYNSAFGHAQVGYTLRERNEIFRNALSDPKNDIALEIGSTSWKSYVDFSDNPPSKIVCVNISEQELRKGSKDAKKADTKRYSEHTFEVMDAHNLEFADGTFDIVFGKEILHHLDLSVAIKEFARVLKPGGEIVFVEPLFRNPVGRLVRRLTPGKRTEFEKPLDKKEIEIIKEYFDLELIYHQLFYVPAGAISKFIFKSPLNPITHMAYKFDRLLLRLFKKTNLGLYYRQVVMKGCLKEKAAVKES